MWGELLHELFDEHIHVCCAQEQNTQRHVFVRIADEFSLLELKFFRNVWCARGSSQWTRFKWKPIAHSQLSILAKRWTEGAFDRRRRKNDRIETWNIKWPTIET